VSELASAYAELREATKRYESLKSFKHYQARKDALARFDAALRDHQAQDVMGELARNVSCESGVSGC
jgi:hypothetical protein